MVKLNLEDKYCVQTDLSESILQRTDGLARRISREADLLPLFKRPGRNPMEVSIAYSTSQAGKERG